MKTRPDPPPSTPLSEDDQNRFLEEAQAERPKLHRYCSRMLGSSLDGEDVVQDTLAAVFFRLAKFDRSKPLAPLLYRVAHNRCIDWLRRRRFESDLEPPDRAVAGSAEAKVLASERAEKALQRLVVQLPPRERSCVLLKDVLEHSLSEIGEIVGCSDGAVKSALHRARTKLQQFRIEDQMASATVADGGRDTGAETGGGISGSPESVAVFEQYVARFNARDWAGLTELLAEDLRLDVVGELEDVGREVLLDRYVVNYGRLEGSWRLSLGSVDGEPVILCLRGSGDGAVEQPAWPVRLYVEGGLVRRIRDYVLCGVLEEANSVQVTENPPRATTALSDGVAIDPVADEAVMESGDGG